MEIELLTSVISQLNYDVSFHLKKNNIYIVQNLVWRDCTKLCLTQSLVVQYSADASAI